MVYKQDFTNVLDIQIERFEKEVSLIRREITEREKLIFSHTETLESVQNARAICALEKELASKNEFIFKLKDKKLFDTSRLNEEYAECMNNFQSLIDKGPVEKDKHEQARFDYIKTEMILWSGKDESVAEKKEACVFYYKALKELTNGN